MHKNKLLIILLGFVWGQWAVAASQIRPLADFSTINLNLAGEVIYRPGAPRLKITAPAASLEQISSDIKNGELQLSLRESVNVKNKICVEVSSPKLSAVVISGSGDLLLKDLTAAEFTLVSAGSGGVTASGKVKQLNVQVSGSGDVNAAQLTASHLRVDVFGSGSVNLRAIDYAHVHVMGAGSATVEGNPVEQVQEAHGTGKIIFKP